MADEFFTVHVDETENGWNVYIEGRKINELNNCKKVAAISHAKKLLNNTVRGGSIIVSPLGAKQEVIDCWKN